MKIDDLMNKYSRAVSPLAPEKIGKPAEQTQKKKVKK
jgi:hypothetical protein